MKYTLDLTVEHLPACRTLFQAGDSYCAMAKIIKGVGLEVPQSDPDGLQYWPEESARFVKDVSIALNDPGWTCDITRLNDSVKGNFRDNHTRAFCLGVERLLRSGIVALKDATMDTKLRFLICAAQ